MRIRMNEKICENEDRIDNHDHQSEYDSIAPVSEKKNFEMNDYEWNEMGGKKLRIRRKELGMCTFKGI